MDDVASFSRQFLVFVSDPPHTMRIASSCSVLILFCLFQNGARAFHNHRVRPSKLPLPLFASSEEKHVETILFVECGFGADAHGQDSTKAAGERETLS
eukprot:scaffold219_cov156-Amphora_coffeaeformis.AAC.6